MLRSSLFDEVIIVGVSIDLLLSGCSLASDGLFVGNSDWCEDTELMLLDIWLFSEIQLCFLIRPLALSWMTLEQLVHRAALYEFFRSSGFENLHRSSVECSVEKWVIDCFLIISSSLVFFLKNNLLNEQLGITHLGISDCVCEHAVDFRECWERDGGLVRMLENNKPLVITGELLRDLLKSCWSSIGLVEVRIDGSWEWGLRLLINWVVEEVEFWEDTSWREKESDCWIFDISIIV